MAFLDIFVGLVNLEYIIRTILIDYHIFIIFGYLHNIQVIHSSVGYFIHYICISTFLFKP